MNRSLNRLLSCDWWFWTDERSFLGFSWDPFFWFFYCGNELSLVKGAEIKIIIPISIRIPPLSLSRFCIMIKNGKGELRVGIERNIIIFVLALFTGCTAQKQIKVSETLLPSDINVLFKFDFGNGDVAAGYT